MQRLLDTRQRRIEIAARSLVVEAHEGQVLRHAQADVATGAQYAVRDSVGRGQYCSGWLALCHPGVHGLCAERLETQAALALMTDEHLLMRQHRAANFRKR